MLSRVPPAADAAHMMTDCTSGSKMGTERRLVSGALGSVVLWCWADLARTFEHLKMSFPITHVPSH